MKQSFFIFIIMLMVFTFTACGNVETERGREQTGTTDETIQTSEPLSNPQNADSSSKESKSKGKILVAYFSWADNALPDDVDAMTSPSVTVPGNVAQLASWVGEETGGELFPIQVEDPYPSDWDGCLDRANQEKGNGTHPALKAKVENLEEYDTVYLGYPNWWYSCPMAIFSFLEENDLSGKQVYLFCSHGTGGLASSVQDISAALRDADISENVFDVYEEDAASAKKEIVEWLKSIG